MPDVRQILSRKGNQTWSIRPDNSVLEALRLMAEHNIGSVLVSDYSDTLIGIFSERDYARKVVLKGKRSAETEVGDVMTREVVRISPDTQIDDCMKLMTDQRIRHLPVMDEGTLVGVVSIGDVVRAIITNQTAMIRDMESYIHGAPGS